MTLDLDVSRILGKIGVSQDSLYYWGLFQNTPKNKFAVLKISGECLEKSLDTIAEDVSDLFKLGFFPIITHGWGKALSKRLKDVGIENRWAENGDRYTDEKVITYVENIAHENLDALVKELSKKGVKVRPLLPKDKVIIAEDKGIGYGKHNGNILEINTNPIYEAIEKGYLPVICPLGVSKSKRKIYNLNSASVGSELARSIDPTKYLMITGTGGVLKDNIIMNELVLRRDYEQMVRKEELSGGMKKNVDEAMQCLASRSNGIDKSVQIVGPGNLLKELFSHRGAGTYIRQGYPIEVEPLEFYDRKQVTSLIEKVFGKNLRREFFTECSKELHIAEGYRGLAVVIENPIKAETSQDIIDYLDILAVDCKYKGNGLGADLIDSVLETQLEKEKTEKYVPRTAKVFWRSKTTRDANNWYYRLSDGHWKFTAEDKEEYNLFWKGLTQHEVTKAKKYVKERPSNFE